MPLRPFVPTRLAIATALMLAATPATAAGASSRAACTPHAVGGTADAASLRLDAAHASALVNWDARDWRRHRVWIALEAGNDGDAPVDVQAQMLLDALPDGVAATALAAPALRVEPHARATQRLAVYVPEDTRTLGLRAQAEAPVALSFALECSDARFDPGEFSPAVAPLLDEAVKTYLDGLVDPLSDPRAAFQAMRVLASGAQDAGDVAWTLRGLMQTVHDDHGFVLAAGAPLPSRPAPAARAPEFDRRPDGIAVVRLHPADTRDAAAALAWATALHDGVADLAAHHPRGWLLDLRDLAGDDPWPAFAGLSALLDGPVVGAWVTRQQRQDWIVDRGVARIAGGPAIVDVQAPPEPPQRGPLAVLIGPNTRDAGEDVTVALVGRPATRFFGAPTAGFPLLGVVVHRLSDGTNLGVLERRDADRQGLIHRQPVAPDVVLEDAPASPPEAVDWILDELSRGAGAR